YRPLVGARLFVARWNVARGGQKLPGQTFVQAFGSKDKVSGQDRSGGFKQGLARNLELAPKRLIKTHFRARQVRRALAADREDARRRVRRRRHPARSNRSAPGTKKLFRKGVTARLKKIFDI